MLKFLQHTVSAASLIGSVFIVLSADILVASLKDRPEVRTAGMFVPGQPFTVTVEKGDRLFFASMFVQSNDKFYALGAEGLDLFKVEGSADLTSLITLWDAGTEIDEPPGVGPHQAPRQSSQNMGSAENGVVRPASDGFAYPATGQVIQVTVGAG